MRYEIDISPLKIYRDCKDKKNNSIDQNTLTWAVANIFPKKLKQSILRNLKWQYSCKISEKFNQQILTQSETCQLCTHKCS